MRDTRNFLLVEDSPDDAFLAQMEFKRFPKAHLTWVQDGEQAITYMKGEKPFGDRSKFPLPDVVLLDLKMPKVGGFDFLEWRRDLAPSEVNIIPVVVMSGSDLERDVKRAYELGANIYMTKPIDWTAFREQMKLMGVLWCEHAKTP
ncbi:MAG TPA: response regulator [Verrucomicrobiae bacterium]|nr:response regulator [Verrucomicrobiae bacterium]